MMGEQLGRQDRLFNEFCLEHRVPADHLLRRIDAVLDLDWLRGELSPYYSHAGRHLAAKRTQAATQETELNVAVAQTQQVSLGDVVFQLETVRTTLPTSPVPPSSPAPRMIETPSIRESYGGDFFNSLTPFRYP